MRGRVIRFSDFEQNGQRRLAFRALRQRAYQVAGDALAEEIGGYYNVFNFPFAGNRVRTEESAELARLIGGG